MDEHNYLDARETAYRKKVPEIINFKEYLSYLPHDIRAIIENRPPDARHYFEPIELIAEAMANSLIKSTMHPDGYRIEWFSERIVVMIIKILTTSDETLIIMFRYLKDPKETVVLITGRDITGISSMIDDIILTVRENINKTLMELEHIEEGNDLSRDG